MKKIKKPFHPRHQREVLDAIEEGIELPYSILVTRERYGTPQRWRYCALILEYCLAGSGATRAAAIASVKEMLHGQHLLMRQVPTFPHRAICTSSPENWHDYSWLRDMKADPAEKSP